MTDGLHVVDQGRGPVVLFSHGTPTSSFDWRHLIAALSPTHRCVAPDHLGFGRSDRPSGADYSPEAHAARFRALAERLDLRDVTLVAHDFGGPIGLPLALDTDRVSRVLLLNTWMWPLDDDRQMALGAKLLGSRLGRCLYARMNLSIEAIAPSAWGDRSKLTAEIREAWRAPFRDDPQARAHVLWALAKSLLGSSAHYRWCWDRRDRLARLPVAIAWGMRDTAFRPNQLARWRAILPEAVVTELPDAGHWPQEEEPAIVLAALRELLSRPSPAR
jgi:haloalkane dehalogenase